MAGILNAGFFGSFNPIKLNDHTLKNRLSVGYSLLNTGQAVGLIGAQGGQTSQFYPGEWLVAGNAANYDVYATFSLNPPTSGITNTWLNLGTSQTWTNYGSGIGGEVICVLSIKIAATNNHSKILSTATITLDNLGVGAGNIFR